ncbi:MAG: stage sporulation protein [Bacillota bacterium]
MRKPILFISSLVVSSILTPVFLSGLYPAHSEAPKNTVQDHGEQHDLLVPVYLTKEQRTIVVPLENYVRNVVASEMPISFPSAALEAQSLAVRTYICRRLANKNRSLLDVKAWGPKAKGACVSDTVKHQVYSTDDQLFRRWGPNYQDNYKKLQAAVAPSKGKVLTWNGKLIYAAFFSTSNGYTENVEDYYGGTPQPYLKSINSTEDLRSPEFERRKTYSLAKLCAKLEKRAHKKITVPAQAAGSSLLEILKRTKGGRVAKVRVGDQEFTGRIFREALDLSSSDFKFEFKDDKLEIITHGYGHGVGLSQWGANFLARAGKSAEDIVAHYYQGCKIVRLKF